MLASMRVVGSSLPMKLLMGMLVVSFAVWGVGDIVRSGNNGHLATVGNEVVTYPEFVRGVNNTQRMLQSMGMNNIPEDALHKQVIQSLVEQKIIEQRLKDAGLEVSQEVLKDHLRNEPKLQTNGKFDPRLFQLIMQERQINEPLFLKEYAADIRSQVFSASLNVDAIQPPEALAKLYSSLQTEKRDAVLFTLPASKVKVEPADEAALKSYYEANKGLLYMSPERRTLEYVTFSADDVAKRAEKDATPEAIADRVASDPEHYKGAEGEALAKKELTAEAMESVIDTITIAIEDALAAGDTMGQAVAAAGLSAQSRILRDVSADDIATLKDKTVQAIAERGFALQDSETSNIETTQDGAYYMVSAQEVIAAEPKPFDLVKADVTKRANARAHTKALRDEGNKLAEALNGAKDWQSVAKEYGASTRTVNNLQRGGTSVPAALNEAIFEREVGGVAGPLVDDASAQLALVTAARFDSAPKDVDAKTRVAMGNDLQKELMGSYYDQLITEYPVRFNAAMMEQISGGGHAGHDHTGGGA